MNKTNRMMIAVMMAGGLLAGMSAQAAKEPSFLKNGDRWVLVGDSITHTDTYRQLVLRVLQHYHPEADIRVGNSAVNGVTSGFQEQREFTPTVVTIMLGMNNIIHGDLPYSSDMKKEMAAYRGDMIRQVQKYKKLGAEVILMAPTYTDERVLTYFNTTSTRRFLEGYGAVVREVAAAEGCHWIPVGEEMEAFQNTLGANQNVRPDGVHPYGYGQYQIARSLWEHLNVAGDLSGKRAVQDSPVPVPVTVTLTNRFMHHPADGVVLKLAAREPLEVKVRWSLDKERGEEVLRLGAEPVVWRIPVSSNALTVGLGSRKWLVVDLTEGGRSSLYVMDLARTKVLTPVDGVVKGTFESDKDRPEGRHVGDWSIREQDGELQISGEMADSEIVATRDWPFARDSVQITLDTRPKDRFASVNPDRDLYGIILGVREKPVFAVSPMAWLGPRLQYAMSASGERTASGYRFWLGVRGGICDYRKFDIRTSDYYGINLSAIDADDTPSSAGLYPALHTDFDDNPSRGLNTLMIVDRKGVFPGKETTNVEVFGR
jgi:lysophospholipase L1-like esterase